MQGHRRLFLELSYRKSANACVGALITVLSNQEAVGMAELPVSSDVVERVVDGTFLWPALMLFEIGLKLLFGFVGIDQKLPACAEC
jgi:hypothetical protein